MSLKKLSAQSKAMKAPPTVVEQPPAPPKDDEEASGPEEDEVKDLDEVEEVEEAPKKRAGKHKGFPPLPSVEDVMSRFEAWADYIDALQEILAEAENEMEGEGDEGSGEEGSEAEEGEEEGSGGEEEEEDEKELYAAESLKERKARAANPLEWGCYGFDLPEGQKQPVIGDVLCCLGEHCVYTKNPELLVRQPAKRGQKTATGYKESYNLLGTDVHLCDRCYDDAKAEINAAAEALVLAKEEEARDTKEVEEMETQIDEIKANDMALKKELKALKKDKHAIVRVAELERELAESKAKDEALKERLKLKKKEITKKEKEEANRAGGEKEVPLVVPEAATSAIEEEYARLGLPRASKSAKKPRRKEDDYDDSDEMPENSDEEEDAEEEEEEDEEEEDKPKSKAKKANKVVEEEDDDE
jgi:hypothetical protein